MAGHRFNQMQNFSNSDAQLDQIKLPPHSVEAEQSVLGGLLLEASALDKIADLMTDGDFYRHEHRLIYRQIVRLSELAKPVDVITVAEALEIAGELDKVGGLAYLGSLAQNVPSAANVRRYGEIVRERSIMRKLVEVGTDIASSAYNPTGRDAAQLLDEAEGKVFEIAEAGSRGKQGFIAMPPLLIQVVERIETLYGRDNQSDVTGTATGFTDLDRMTSGLQAGELIIVAGRPSMGKTAFSVNIAENVALDSKLPVAIFSMEMGASQLAMRMLGSVGKLNQHDLRTGRLQDDDWGRLTHALGKLNDAPIHIDESAALSVLEVRARARRLHRQNGGLGLIVVDYIQLMSSNAGKASENRATEISEISRSLKSLAKELHVPVVALSQLNRSLEQRPNKRPVMSDLRECVIGDTLVCLANGTRVPIRDLVGQQPVVWAFDPNGGIVAAKSDKVWSVGTRPVFRLSLASGRSIQATGLHRLYGAQGWVRLQEIKTGDRLALARRIPVPDAVVEWPDHCITLLGHLAGDGSYLVHQPLRYTTASEENSAAVVQAAQHLGSTVTRHAGRGNWHQLVIAGNGNRWHAEGVGKWLKELGIHGQRSHVKRLPDQVFQFDDRQIGLLLQHLWATDGSIFVRKAGNKGAPRVYFSTCSEGLASDVAALLARLGIVARLRKVLYPTARPVYTVDVSGAQDQSLFLERVGAFGPRLQPARELAFVLQGLIHNTNVDTLPQEVFAEVRAEMSRLGISTRKMSALRGTAYGGASHFQFAPSRALIRDYAESLGSERLRALCSDTLFWDTVVAIEPVGELEVFDLTVPGPASWLADGIVSHNSGAIEQDADLILFIYRDEVYNSDSPDKGKAEIIVAKQRNGPIGKVELAFRGEYTRFDNLASGSY